MDETKGKGLPTHTLHESLQFTWSKLNFEKGEVKLKLAQWFGETRRKAPLTWTPQQ